MTARRAALYGLLTGVLLPLAATAGIFAWGVLVYLIHGRKAVR